MESNNQTSEVKKKLKLFECVYLNKDGIKETSVMGAGSLEEAKSRLDQNNVQNILKIYEKKSGGFTIGSLLSRTIKPVEMINIFSIIRTMEEAGLAVVKSLEMLKGDVAPDPNIRAICEKAYNALIAGDSLSDAFEKASPSFTPDIVSIISIGEKTGKYGTVLQELIAYIEWHSSISAKSKSAMIGPLMSILFMFGMIMLMANYAVPKMIEFISNFDAKIPASTQLLMDISKFIQGNLWFVLGGFFLTPVLFWILMKVLKPFKKTVDRLLLGFPLIGKVMLMLDVSRFIAFFTLMYNSGSDILLIIERLSRVLSNDYLKYRLKIVYKKIESGVGLGIAMSEEVGFPSMFRRMFIIGEMANDFSGVLNSMRTFYENEAKNAIDTMIKGIKPLMMILMAIMVSWVGSAMLGPIYSNIANIVK